MRRLAISVVIAMALASTFFGPSIASGSSPSAINLNKRLTECASVSNGSSLTVVQTTRMLINLPKDIFPNIKLKMLFHGASASSISNAGAYGYASGADGRPNCWSYFFDFELTAKNNTKSGTLDIGSKSGIPGIPNYLIHFKVVVDPPDMSRRSASKGNVQGQVLLGPVCPVERLPADPACAPKPFKTTINAFSMLTGSAYKTVTSSDSGRFSIWLDPGAYVIQARGGDLFPRCTATTVKVYAKKKQNVTLNCDTGIR